MPTDDERREAARRLREVQSDVIPGTKTEVHPIAGRIIGVACGYDLPGFQGLLGRLADLIDPDTTTDTTKSPDVTTKCDRDALLALADEMQGELDGCESSHEIAGNLQYWVDHIREACGEVA